MYWRLPVFRETGACSCCSPAEACSVHPLLRMANLAVGLPCRLLARRVTPRPHPRSRMWTCTSSPSWSTQVGVANALSAVGNACLSAQRSAVMQAFVDSHYKHRVTKLEAVYSMSACSLNAAACASCPAGQLWELDGRRTGPISHGPTQQDTLLQDVARVAKDFMAR
jgi:hypothetical protein